MKPGTPVVPILALVSAIGCGSSMESDDTRNPAWSYGKGAADLRGSRRSWLVPGTKDALAWPLVDGEIDAALYESMTTRGKSVRGLAEWEPVDGILVDWDRFNAGFHRYSVDLIREVTENANAFILVANVKSAIEAGEELVEAGAKESALFFFTYEHQGNWTRDFGPIPIEVTDGTGTRIAYVDPRYHDSRKHDDQIPTLLASYFYVPVVRSNLSLEGGNLVSNGDGLCLTTMRTVRENNDLSEDDVRAVLRNEYGCERAIILPTLNGEPTGHVDMYAKFTQRDVVLVGEYSEDSNGNAVILNDVADFLASVYVASEQTLRVVRVPMPAQRFDRTLGAEVNETYINSVLVNNKAIVPVYKNTTPKVKAVVKQRYQDALPEGYDIAFIDASRIIDGNGSVHCTTAPIVGTHTMERWLSYGVKPFLSIVDGETIEDTIEVFEDDEAPIVDEVRVQVQIAGRQTPRGDLRVELEHRGMTATLLEESPDRRGRSVHSWFATAAFQGMPRDGKWTLRITNPKDPPPTPHPFLPPPIREHGRVEGWGLRFVR